MSIQEISPQQANEMFSKGDCLLIDVREPAEHASSHIPNSYLHPLGKISAASLSNDKNILIYCQKGARGKKACEKLLQDNSELNVFNIQGGIEAWDQAGHETKTTDKGILPLDRQVQLSIGVLLILFSTLALSVSSLFAWATGFIGLGLFVAGTTGFCGLGRLIAIMPWNQRS